MVFYRGLKLFFNYKHRLITYFMKFLVKQFIVDRRVKLISSRLLLNFRFIKKMFPNKLTARYLTSYSFNATDVTMNIFIFKH
jgi:hypothetical protein